MGGRGLSPGRRPRVEQTRPPSPAQCAARTALAGAFVLAHSTACPVAFGAKIQIIRAIHRNTFSHVANAGCPARFFSDPDPFSERRSDAQGVPFALARNP